MTKYIMSENLKIAKVLKTVIRESPGPSKTKTLPSCLALYTIRPYTLVISFRTTGSVGTSPC
jgi:hypothetical protein